MGVGCVISESPAGEAMEDYVAGDNFDLHQEEVGILGMVDFEDTSFVFYQIWTSWGFALKCLD